MANKPTKTIKPFPAHGTEESDIEGGFKRFGTMPTPKDVRKQLWGIPLKSPLTGEEITDEMLQDEIHKAVSAIEHDLKLYISPVTINREPHNYRWSDFYHSFCFIQLKQRPVLEIHKVEVSIPSANDQDNLVEWPTGWVRGHHDHGQIQLVPLSGSGSILITQIGSGANFPVRLFNSDHFPQFWRVSYRVGFENDEIPLMITSLIETVAALRLLELVAPILFPHSSYSLNIDGLGQAVGLPGPTWLTGRINSLKERKEEYLAAARSFYQLSLSMDVLG